jgi:high affinity sulfate transporter 1
MVRLPLINRLLLSTPGLARLIAYQRSWLRGDVLAGITVAAYLIPQCMAYGELAGVPPIAGLWAILFPMLLYALLGSSPQLSVGPESTTAVMTAAALAPWVSQDAQNYPTLAALLALLVGAVCCLGYATKLGFLADLLSRPILIGYMVGIAILMMVGQLDKISGIPITGDSVLEEIWVFLSHLDQLHWPTLVLTTVVLFFLFGIQHWCSQAPGPLLAVLLATLAVALLGLEQKGIIVVGPIPAGLPQLRNPVDPDLFSLQLLASAVGIALVGYSDTVLTARAFESRDGYRVDANQELLALGIANLATGLTQGFPISSSGSRTAIGDALGSKSQLFSLVSFGVVVLVLIFLRPLLSLFPKPALGAIVIFAATRLIDVSELMRLKRFGKNEFFLAIATTTGVIATNILAGVTIAVSLSVIDLFARVARPHAGVLGQVPGLTGLHNIGDWESATTIPGLVVYRYDAPLCFANAEDFKQRAMAAVSAEQEPVQWFLLNAEAIIEIDLTAADALAELQQKLAHQGITFALARVKQKLYCQLQRAGLVQQIGPEHFYPTLPTAVAAFQRR